MNFRTKQEIVNSLQKADIIASHGILISRIDSDAIKRNKQAEIAKKIQDFAKDNKDLLFLAIKLK